ncbi:coiled-coil domain-containing protein 178 isoform X2 [Esox lucius]|uniref:Coiled-coil domain containing 178 n=1 Tax=Esox lucius TaxID=8010 RepID=A0A6Q2WW88_ESOLU|nr:coiled-coil domain-containing protein 178 isoform X2 [Esox lucius]
MPEIELRFPSREGAPSLQDQEDLRAVCPSRRRSCALVNTPSPCVNKAVCHIQELKKRLENWCQQSGNVKHQVSHEKHPKNTTIRFHSNESESSMMSTELYIEGIGLSAREEGLLSPLRKETTDVLVEVVYLIERLEADRQDAEEALQTEKRRRRALAGKIDSISVWKQQEFPVAVQKEHEACTRDIRELEWHLKLRRDKLHQVKDKVTKMEVLNQRLKEDIDFVKTNGPLVKEKLQLERDCMDQINMAQHEAHETFSKTLTELKSCQEEMRKKELKADEEREWMFHELKGIKNQLNERLTALQELRGQWGDYCVEARETEKMATLKENEYRDMSLSIPELEVQEAAANHQVLELKIEIEIEGRKIAKLREEIPELQKEVHEARLAGESALSLLDEVFSKKRQDILALHQENNEYDLEIEEYTKQIYESEQTVKQLQKDRKRMLQKITANEQDRDAALEELSQVETLHGHTTGTLEVLEQRTFTEEQRSRKVIENLKKDLVSEMKALAILKGKIATFKAEFQQEQMNTAKARMELGQEFEEATSATKQMEVKTEKLRQMHNDKSKKIESLNNQLGDILMKNKNTSDYLEKEKNLRLESLNTEKELHQGVSKRFDQALSRIADLTAKSKEYRIESDNMEKIASTMPDVIEELQSVFDATGFKNQTATLIMNTLECDISGCQQRIEQILKTHSTLFTTRQQKMQEIKLSLLQKRMHKAVVKSFRQRHLYSLAELARFQILSNQNNQKIKGVQEELSGAIQRISAFLLSLSDDSTTSDDAATMQTAAGKKEAGPDAIGLNRKKKMPTVQITV